MSAMSAVPPPRSSTRPPADPSGPAGTRPAGPAGTRPAWSRGGADTAPASPSGGGATRLVAMVRDFTTLFLEVEAGRRPRRQLAGLLTPMLYARLTDIWVRGGTPGHVVTVTLLSREATHADLVARVRRGDRHGALSLRLVRVPGRGWLVDVVARPEDGHLPAPAYPVVADDGESDLFDIPDVTAAPAAPPDWLVAH